MPHERMTVREIIHERVYQEFEDHRLGLGRFRPRATDPAHGIAPPASDRTALSPQRPTKPQEDWRTIADRLCNAFTRQQLLVLVGHSQAASLDQTYTLTPGTEVTFIRLVMLVGG